MKKPIIMSLMLILGMYSYAQNFTISGYITDANNGEKLIGANVYDANTYKGSSTNAYGFYSITLDKQEVMLTISYVGYATYQQKIALTKDIILNIELKPTIEIDEVLVEGKSNVGGVESSQMSIVEIPMKTLKNLPVLLGETDIIKTIQLLPGVQSGSEGMSGMYVRGGGPDQNLILLDGVPVYNASHLFGFFSVFNSDAIQNVTLIKGGFPARYGGRLSSVLDISMKEGNIKKFKGMASIGLISSKIALEGPIGEKTSFLISGRRTYIDVLTYPFQAIQEEQMGYDKFRTGYYFYDVNAKINHKLNDKNRLYLSAYLGKDRFYSNLEESYTDEKWNPETGEIIKENISYEDQMEFWWGNVTTALRWNHTLTKKLFVNTTATYSRYKMLTGYESKYGNEKPDVAKYSSGIEDYSAKVDFDYFLNTNHTFKSGASYTYHAFNPGVLTEGYNNTDTSYISTEMGNSAIYSHEMSAYIEDDIRIGSLLKMNIGVRWSGFQVKTKMYNAFEPRISGRLLLNENWSVKAAYANMNQYINLLANSNIGLPFDLWVPSTETVKPQKANQVALGSIYSFKNFDISVEGFYKEMKNLVEYKEGATFYSFENDWEDKVTQGEGWSYGLELLLMKKYGKATGWIGYTWSKSERRFNEPGSEISEGMIFPYKYDRRHDLSIVLSYKLKDNIDIGATWVYGTGNATTLGLEKYPSYNQTANGNGSGGSPDITYYEHRNNYRMPSYHRLDIGINFHKDKSWGKRTWNISVYNAYNRKNPFILNWEHNYEKGKTELIQYSLFPIIPSFSYRIEF